MRRLRKMRAFLCVLLVSALVLPGCSGSLKDTESSGTTQNGGQIAGEPAEQAKGRFLETELALPEKIHRILGVRKCEDGSLVLFGYDENEISLYRACSDNQGKDWEETELEYGSYRLAAIDADGSAALLGYCMKEDDRDILLVDPDGKTSYVHLNMPEYHGRSEDTSNMILSAACAAGKLFVTDLNDRIYEVDRASGEMTEFSKSFADDTRDILPFGSRLAALTTNGVQLLNAADETPVDEDETLKEALGVVENYTDSASYPLMLAAGENEDEMYYVNHDGIFYHKLGNSSIEQLANGELLSVGDESVLFRALARFDDEHFVVFAIDSLGKERCYSYAYDANASAVPEKLLTVYALEDSTVLQQLVNAYQKEHQDVFVKKMIGMSGDDSVTAEDAIKTLNTEIMAGNGPDVLVLDGLPVDSYIEKGILSDIGAYVTEADAAEGLFTNITDAYKKDGALYQVPMRFFCTFAEWEDGVGAISGKPKQVADTVSSLRDGNIPVLTNLPAEMFLYAFYNAYSASWQTESGIDAAALRESLEAAKTLYDLDGYAESERFDYDSLSVTGMYQGQSIYGTVSAGSQSRLMEQARISIGTLSGVGDVTGLYGIESSSAGAFGLLSDGVHKAFVPFVSLGLAESAKDNELAQAFLRMALSADGQYQMTDNFSINKKAYENEVRHTEPYSISFSGPDGKASGYEVKPLDETQEQALTEILESLNAPTWSDRVVQELVIGEGKKYLYGEQSLEDAVSAITKKVQLYVSE